MVNNLGAIDLNLLVVLDALLAERHVSRAALRLNKSQPAVSHALARLRALFDDPLLVRHGGHLEPTVRALEIAPQLAEALAHMRLLMGSQPFDPAREPHVFRLAMSDYAALVLLPQLMTVLRRQAPNVDLLVSQASREVMMAQAVDGEIDLALGVFPTLAEDLRTSLLFEEHFACLADRASLGGEKTMDLSAYLQRPHILVSCVAIPATRSTLRFRLLDTSAALRWPCLIGVRRRVSFPEPTLCLRLRAGSCPATGRPGRSPSSRRPSRSRPSPSGRSGIGGATATPPIAGCGI